MNPNNFNYHPSGYQQPQMQILNSKERSSNQFQINMNPYPFQNIQVSQQKFQNSPSNSYTPLTYQNQAPNPIVVNPQRYSFIQPPVNSSPQGIWNKSNYSSNAYLTSYQSPSSNANFNRDDPIIPSINNGESKVQRSKSLAQMNQLKSSNMLRSNIDQQLTTPSGNYQSTFFKQREYNNQLGKKNQQNQNKQFKMSQYTKKQDKNEDNIKHHNQINLETSNILKNIITKFTWYYEQNDEHLIKLKYLQKIRQNMSIQYFLEQYQKTDLVKSCQKVQDVIKQFLEIQTELSKNLSSSINSLSKKASDEKQDEKYLEYFKQQLENQKKKYDALQGQIKKKEYILEKEKDKLMGIIKQKNSELQLISSHIGPNKSKQYIIFDEDIQLNKGKNISKDSMLTHQQIDGILNNLSTYQLGDLQKVNMLKLIKKQIIAPITQILLKKMNKSVKQIDINQKPFDLNTQLKNEQRQFMDLQMKIMNIEQQYQNALKNKEVELTELKKKFIASEKNNQRLIQSQNKREKINQGKHLYFDKATSPKTDKVLVEVQQIVLDRLLQQIKDLQSACEILRREKQQLISRINEIWQQYEKESPKFQAQIDKIEAMKQSMGLKMSKKASQPISIKDEEQSQTQNRFSKLQHHNQLQYSLQEGAPAKKSRQLSKSEIQDRIVFNEIEDSERQDSRKERSNKKQFLRKYQEERVKLQQNVQQLRSQILVLQKDLRQKREIIQQQQQQSERGKFKIHGIEIAVTELEKVVNEKNKKMIEKDKVIEMRNFDIEELENKLQHVQRLLEEKDIKSETIIRQLELQRNQKESLQRRLNEVNPELINIKMIEFKNKLQEYQDSMKHLSDFFTKVQNDKQKYDKIKHQKSKNAQLFENKALYKLKEENQLLKRKVYSFLINIYSHQSIHKNIKMEKSYVIQGQQGIDANGKKKLKMPNSYTIQELLIDCILQLQPVLRWGCSGNISPQYQLNLENIKSYLIQSQKKLRMSDKFINPENFQIQQSKPIKMRASTVVKSMKSSRIPQIQEKNQLLNFYKNKIQELQRRVAQLLDINIQMKEQFNESLKQKNKKGHIQIEYLMDQVQSYKKQVASYQENIHKLEHKPKKSMINKSLIEEKDIKVASLQNQLQQAYNKQFDLTSLLKIFQNSIMIFSQTIRKLESRLREKLNKQFSTVNRQIYQYIQEIQISVTNYFNQISQAKNKYNHLNQNNQNNFYEESSSPANFQLKKNLDRRSQGYNRNASIKVNLYPQYEKKQQLVLKKQISNMNDHAMTVRSEMPDNNTTIIQEENYKLKQQIKKLNQYVNKLPNDPKNSMLRLRNQKNDMQKRINELQYKLSAEGSFKATIESLRSQNHTLKQQLMVKNQHSAPLLEKVKRLQFIIQKLDEQINRRNKVFQDLKFSIEKLRSNLIQNGSLWEELFKLSSSIQSSNKSSLNAAYTANLKRGFSIIEEVNQILYR